MQTIQGATMRVARISMLTQRCCSQLRHAQLVLPGAWPGVAQAISRSGPWLTTKPFDSDASDVTRAIQFIQPVSNPTKSPNAERA